MPNSRGVSVTVLHVLVTFDLSRIVIRFFTAVRTSEGVRRFNERSALCEVMKQGLFHIAESTGD